MRIFGKDHTEDINFLNDERKAVWARIVQLETKVEEKPSDIEKDAKQALKKASEYRNRAKESKEEAEKVLNEINSIKNTISQVKVLLEASKQSLDSQISIAKDSAETLQNLEQTTNSKVETIENKVHSLEKVFIDHPDIDSEIENLETLVEKINDSNSKVNAILKNTASRKAEIDEIYYEIVGNEIENEETGKIERTEGLRDNLENQYKELDENLKKKNTEIQELYLKSDNNFKKLLDESNKSVDSSIISWEKKYSEYEKTIEQLLPRALTAGLSSAFYQKKKDEVESFKSLRVQFNWGIFGLVLVSIIPFLVSIYFLVDNASWDVVINRAPRLVIAILPLYLPVLWLAYSANKKMNLSKRLIEEYSHKEVLSRTFEGLSNQIENLEDNEAGKELKLKLLYEFLSASSENPGKLISNYEASDHPVMDVLEKSYKLEDAIERLGKIPGFSKIAKMTNKKVQTDLQKKAEKVKKGIDAVTDIIDGE